MTEGNTRREKIRMPRRLSHRVRGLGLLITVYEQIDNDNYI